MVSPPSPSAVFPPPERGYWAILDISLQHGSALTFLQVSTDANVRLYLAIGSTPPSSQAVRRRRRGVEMQKYTLWRWQPDGWIPQLEPGEGQVHSWQLGDWPVGVPIWYYFDGRQNGGVTVSSSILFGSVKPPLLLAQQALLTSQVTAPLALTRDYTHELEPERTLTHVT